jgi:hypothetical protein
MALTIDVHHHILPDFFWRETNLSAADREKVFGGTASSLLPRLGRKDRQ